jgi:drug/metabolite transporter (DMT)-like permease
MGIAGGLLFSIGDFSTKLATQGGTRFAFAVTLIIGYTLGTSLLQLGYQRGAALTVAGLATLITNAAPILAGTIVLEEPVPSGLLGALRILAFAAVTAGAILLASPERQDARDDAPGTRVAGPTSPAMGYVDDA